MTDFDTSGIVQTPPKVGLVWGVTRWPDLSLFVQGYVKAAMEPGLFSVPHIDEPQKHPYPAFHLLAPETLAAMMADCDRYEEQTGGSPPSEPYWGMTEDMGAEFFRRRQFERWPDFPPVTLTIGDNGKVYQEVRA